ncbi:GCN5-related N-acetyltransferase [Shewanella halifaxensis HAW-EB4]|uniref:GCN5-related N-acetyltransferase n=1 Tax=Shewanella halifaxensis (strain HAW-EB4) TaxID=458817 RepID=B0TS27_SHEHH|nr:GNAT family N-acetyltransferase [Shewanella halifaxensis]ABZ75162.1 GCN5-related N-acetyltransferase [Shewanella halifaxensis HAW-EB4]
MSKLITKTARLIIREFNLDDIQAVYDFNADERVNRYTGDAGVVQSLADAERIIRDIWLTEYLQFGYARWAVVLKETNSVIGFCGFKNDYRINETDIGYRFAPEHWGKGYATEANQACIEYAKDHLDLDYIVGDVVEENLASINVLLKLGMTFNKKFQDMGFTVIRYDMYLKSKS